MKPLIINSSGKKQQLPNGNFLEVGTGISQNNGAVSLSLDSSTLTVQPSFTLNTFGSGNIDLPNNGSSRFKIEGVSISSNVSATNLNYLVAGAFPTNTASFLTTAISPILNQENSSATETGDALTIQAQNVTGGTTSVGGKLTLQSGSGTLTGANNFSAGSLEFKLGTTSVGAYSITNGGDFRWTLDSALSYMIFAANGSSQYFNLQATSGNIYFDAPTITFRDAVSANTLTFSLAASTPSEISFVQSTSGIITQATRTSDVPTKELTIRTQAAFSSATGPSRDSGALIFLLPDPVTGGNYGRIYKRYGVDETQQSILAAYKFTTSNNTPITAATFALSESSVYSIKTRICARDTINGLNNIYELNCGVRRNGSGSATLIGSADQTLVKEEAAGWDAILDVSGNNLIVTVTGAAAADTVWFIELEALFLFS